MEKHLNELLTIVPDLLTRKILDLGAGRGEFVRMVVDNGGMAEGVEPYDKYVEIAKNKFGVDLTNSNGEKIPFSDKSFGFVNMAEVMEHVADPKKVMNEVYRILEDGGLVYVSVPCRFGFKDPHFHLYFVNWLPRIFADSFISLFGKHKDYSVKNGRQRLGDMHYMTYCFAKTFFNKSGFDVEDIRAKKIKIIFPNPYARFIPMLLYKILRSFYFSTFHFLLHKKAKI